MEGVSIEDFSERAHTSRQADKRKICISWISQYMEIFCDADPASKEVHLPCVMSKKDLFDVFYYDMITNHKFSPRDSSFPSESLFFYVWRTHFSHLVVPRNARLGKCTKCTLLQNKKPAYARNARIWHELMKKHMNPINAEKENYYDRIENSRKFPAEYGSLIIDFYANKKIPHNSTFVKDWLLLHRLNFDLCCVINHGTWEQHFFPFMPIFKFTSDINISILSHVIRQWQEKYKLPKILQIQVFSRAAC
jgi:hypothetical protein